ncbi:RDD family protein [Nocardioides albertanoniae]|uniref:RDD family protein n=1 Tax=Nocardioides albertanoniae TaxID=1175486 RepID=A0A543ADW2_9ACTN|nr:RDD family protein [Nocardioides albertanoniae]TQL70773.1 RDD family protein [Nocardioides albertanoniae]
MSNFGPPAGPPPGMPPGPPPGSPPGPPPGTPPWQQQAYAPTGPALAHWGLRAGGALIDAALLLPFYLVAGVGGGLAQESGFFVTAFGLLVTLVGWVGVVAFAVWNYLIKQGRTGRTIGKRVVGIKLVPKDAAATVDGRTDGTVGVPVTLLRQVLHVLDGFCMVGYLWPLWDEKRQTFADKLVGTLVVEAKS